MKRIIECLKWRLGLTPEARSRRALERVAPPAGALALDCGANVGAMTVALASRGATVHAFEPNPHAFAVLEQRFRDRPHVICHHAAVGCNAECTGTGSEGMKFAGEPGPLCASMSGSQLG